ncbi:MAG: TraR/DksA C4-type zinc finger protein [Ilumatobacteraceae bacterium]
MDDLHRRATADTAPDTSALSAPDLDALRTSLVDQRSAAEVQIAELARAFEDIVEAVELTNNDDEHDPEGTTIAFERAQVAALLSQARADLEAVDLALQRMEDRKYGRCDVCGDAIGRERLSAIPSAAKCISCA